MTPTPEAVEALERELQLGPLWLNVAQSEMAAAWILSRFVRREEHERVVARCATCSACTPDATPKGDGSRWAKAIAAANPGRDDFDGGRTLESVSTAGERDCNATPAGEDQSPVFRPAAPVTSITPNSMLLLEHHCSEADFATIGKLRDESYAAGYSAGRDAAARLNVKQVSHVVELGSETLRTLVAAIIGAGGKDWHVVEDAIDATDHLLTHLCEKEKTR